VGFTLPIGRLRRMRRTLRDERNLLDVLLDSIDVAVVACDAGGRLTHSNRRTREMMSGVCPKGLHHEDWSRRFRLRSPDGRPFRPGELPLGRALSGETVRGADVLADAGGEQVLLSACARPVHDAHGNPLGAVVVFEDVTEQRAREARLRAELGDLGWVTDLEEAFREDRFLLYAQPIVDLRSGETALEELLLRMRSPDGTIIGPYSFLGAAERHGTITEIDTWVLEQAARIAGQGRPVTVNVSARTVSTPTFLRAVELALQRHGVQPSLITFEITETAVVSDIVQATRFAERLHAIGCHFALDDFGTGYAALTYLKHLPIRYLKIDMEFVHDIAENPRSRAVVAGIVALAAAFGQTTIAEGVEDAATLELLRELGVDLAQGFHVGRPAPIVWPSEARAQAR
jgi:EAL domain-containing protein (putative c-di-GMP-specific phosphodiesterase class I)